MFQGHYRLYARLLFGIDAVSPLPVLLAAYTLRDRVNELLPASLAGRFQPELLPLGDYLLYLAVMTPLWVGILMLTQSYGRLIERPLRRQFRRVLAALVILGGGLALAAFSAQLIVSRAVFFGFLGLLGLAMAGWRLVLHWGLRSRNLYEHSRIRILIVGTDERARQVARRLEGSRKWGFHVVGFVAVEEGERDADVVCTLERLPDLLLEKPPADEIIIAESRRRRMERYQELIQLCEELGIRTRLAADFLPASESSVSVEFLGDTPFLTFSNVPDHTVGFVAKRIVDFAVAAALLLVASPILMLVGIAVRLQSPGSALYRQERCGLYGRRFQLLKFRTMIDGAEDRLWEIRHLNEMDGPVFKMRNDPRVTSLGRYLRRYSIDELPQLWNVIKGEMSLVGPRAPLPEEVRAYSVSQRRRLSVKPGITCLWQVAGRSDIDFGKWMEMDLAYIDNWSFWLDLRIMLKTIPAVFTGRGAR